MTAELVRHQPAPATLPEKMEYARALAVSGMLPSQYRNQPANLLYALEFAGSLGLHPMAAITGVHVIEGKPSASSALISALVRRAGHKLRVTGNDQEATAQIVRADDPEFTFSCTWTWSRAEQAGLTRKQVWKNYPAAMLKARAITEVAREACEEALSGMHYTPEELGANVNEEGLPVEAEVQQLHRVQPGEGDPWTAPQTAAQGRDYLHEAHEASDAAAVRQIWREAQADGAVPDYLEQIAAVGKDKAVAAPPASAAAPEATDEDVVDAEVLSPEDDYAEAVAQLRAAAEAARLENFEEGTEQALGMPLADAPVSAIRALTAQIRPAA
ncbi:hypothetical protein G3I43_07055 [Streptomyces anulatus]|uniref:Recombinase RecT n=1 Tax=Streptomyces anulatus TaxID=1892 RepID=A0A6G3SLP1_STRAQ|nr:hypothetical protein [Streptomyces anulatus]NEB83937.1 hypothetical protein [Streptomyces anulatus]